MAAADRRAFGALSEIDLAALRVPEGSVLERALARVRQELEQDEAAQYASFPSEVRTGPPTRWTDGSAGNRE